MKYNIFLIISTIGLLFWLLQESSFELDIQATKNEYLSRLEKDKISHLENIEALKSYAISKIDQRREYFINDSAIATNRIRVVIGMMVCQFLILFVVVINKKIS